MKELHFLLALLLLLRLADASDYTDLCRLLKKNTKLKVPGTCGQYIVCNGADSIILSCETSATYDAKEQKCITNLDDATATESKSATCFNPCLNAADDTFVANPTNCRACYYCKNSQAMESYCADEYHFEQDSQKCVYPSKSKCVQNVNNICDHVADKTVLRDESDCSKYYKCEKNKLTKVDCKKQYFNVETGKCVEKSTVACTAHQATEDTCLKNKKPFVGLRPDGATCRGYYICTNKGLYAHDLAPVWYQCPAGKFFEETTEECLPPVDVKCPYNRCEGRGNATVTSGKNNCRNYIECQNNRVFKEVTCRNDFFFDERLQACVRNPIYDNCCDDEKTHSK